MMDELSSAVSDQEKRLRWQLFQESHPEKTFEYSKSKSRLADAQRIGIYPSLTVFWT